MHPAAVPLKVKEVAAEGGSGQRGGGRYVGGGGQGCVMILQVGEGKLGIVIAAKMLHHACHNAAMPLMRKSAKL